MSPNWPSRWTADQHKRGTGVASASRCRLWAIGDDLSSTERSGRQAVRYRYPIEPTDLPILLAEQHRALPVGAMVTRAELDAGTSLSPSAPISFDDLAAGAGFGVCGGGRYERLESLPDFVAPEMRLLIVGLNPSPSAADAGVGFARPGNRFWPAALAAGVVSIDRDPVHALRHHGIGFTDLAKRTTRRAAELAPEELEGGFDRVDRLCRWLRPAACAMVGLQGWRTVVDRNATAGWHTAGFGDVPVYVMPSTSGLNAHASLDDLTAHLATAIAGPPSDARLTCRQ